ncbi:MAG TPA: methyltransferase [Candidatus Acidoferrales bacterium]|nr:methyltransferase [Candidatus Acidoferrales bacterium]
MLRDSWRRLGEVLPEMRRPWCAAVVWGSIAVATLGCLLLGRLAARAVPGGALLVQSALVLWAGTWMLPGFWRHRAAYRERYGTQAYRYLFFRFLAPFFAVGGAAIYFPLLVDGERLLPPAIAYGFAAYLLVTAQLMEVRGKEIFWDIEWRPFVYNVFPERGRTVTAGIFHWLRHPVYSAGIRFAIALALLRNNAPALLCAAVVAVGLAVWGRIEERELEQKDAGYATYRRRTPAFFVLRPLRFWRFLLTGEAPVQG